MSRDPLSEFLRMFSYTSFGKIGRELKVADIVKTYIEQYLEHCDKKQELRKHIFKNITKICTEKFGVFDRDTKNIFDADKTLTKAIKEATFGVEDINIATGGITKRLGYDDLESDLASLVLINLGFMSVDEGKIIPGWQKNAGRFLPSSVEAGLSALGIGFDTPNLRRAYLEKVSRAQNIKRRIISDVEEKLSEITNKINSSMLRETGYDLRKLAKEEFIDCGNSTQFYGGITSLYTESSEFVYVFSTTSGLVIPEEYHGNEAKGKDEYRQKYFDQGIGSGLAKVAYQWDPYTTGKRLWEWMGREHNVEKRRRAENLLASFLELPHLVELSEADFSKDPYSWKKHFTLVSPGFNIVFSVRDDTKKISHGLLANPENKYTTELIERIRKELGAEGDTIFNIVSFCHKAGEKTVLKAPNEILSSTQAERRAEEIVDHLIEIGKQKDEKNK